MLAEFRAPYRGRSTPVNAWWGSFDLSVNLFSGLPADPPSDDFIMRNSMDAQEVAVGWWPGDPRHDGAAFFAYAHPAPDGFAGAALEPAAARWDDGLGLYMLEWSDVVARRTRTPPRSSSPAPPSGTPASSATGTRASPPPPRETRPQSPDGYGRVRNWPRNERATGVSTR